MANTEEEVKLTKKLNQLDTIKWHRRYKSLTF